MVDKTIVITGASDGIGKAAAQLLATHKERIIIVGRSPNKTETVARELHCPFYVADFTNFHEVRDLAADLQRDLTHIDVLVNNAGGIMGARQLTVDGNEMTFQVNHLAPFLLSNLLLDTLIASRASIIVTSSLANRMAGTLDIDDPNLEFGYNARRAYSKTKLMNILFVRELHRRFHSRGIAAASFHPGIVRTHFASEFPNEWRFIYTSITNHFFRSPTKGADTLVWLATSRPDEDWISGEYYKNRRISKAIRAAYDTELARRLWHLSESLTTPY